MKSMGIKEPADHTTSTAQGLREQDTDKIKGNSVGALRGRRAGGKLKQGR